MDGVPFLPAMSRWITGGTEKSLLISVKPGVAIVLVMSWNTALLLKGTPSSWARVLEFSSLVKHITTTHVTLGLLVLWLSVCSVSQVSLWPPILHPSMSPFRSPVSRGSISGSARFCANAVGLGEPPGVGHPP